jgi:hypothetical protein
VAAAPFVRLVLFGVLAGVTYYALLSFIMPLMPFDKFPHWLRALWSTPELGLLVWFGMLGICTALLAAIPASCLLLWGVGKRSFALGVIVALLVAGYDVASAVLEYPTSSDILAMDAINFVSFALALPAVVALLLIRRNCIGPTRHT